jgi:hypothetical protein
MLHIAKNGEPFIRADGIVSIYKKTSGADQTGIVDTPWQTTTACYMLVPSEIEIENFVAIAIGHSVHYSLLLHLKKSGSLKDL